MLTLEELNGGFSLGDWDVLPSQRILRRDEHVERPEPMVFDVLLALAERDGDLVTKDELIDEVIQQKISQLRGHLGDQRPYEYVGTLPRKGYQLLQPVVLHRQSETESHGPPPVEARSDRRWKAVATAVLLGFLAIAWVIGNDREEGLPAACSLAVLPIENLSGDPNNLYIAEGIKNTLAQRLNELPECTIKIAREVYDGEWTDIAKQLGVASLLHGTVQLQDDTVKIDYFIILGRDGTQSDSGQVSGALGNLFDIQERLARAKLEHRFEGNNLEDAIELFQESIRRDESYGPAYLGLATAYALLPDYRNADLETNHRLAIETIEEGIEKDGSITDPAGAIYGFVYYQKKQWLEAEKNYQRAVTAPVVDANAFSWYSMMLAATGRIEDARDMALAAEDLAPDNGVLASRIAMVYTWLNNTAKAYEYFDRANDLHATGTIHVIAHALLLQRNGQLELSQNLAFAAVTMESGATDWIDKVYAALGERTPERIAIALDAINQAWEERRVSPEPVLVTRSLLGDIDGAMAIARLLEEPGMLFSMEILFMPELMPLREHPEFLPLLERLGVVGYWDSVGCRWVDHRVDCQD
jgi:DNA-binding winged helix-turn-helix (wHTH) protein/TolB-like protein